MIDKIKRWIVPLLAALSIVACSGAAVADDPPAPPSAEELAALDTTTTVAVAPENPQGDFTVTPEELAALEPRAKCTSNEFLPASALGPVAGDPTRRQFSNAVSNPVPADVTDPVAILDVILAENCGNPTVGDMNIRGLGEIIVGDQTVRQLNAWWMEEYFTFLGDQTLRAAFLTNADCTSSIGICVTSEYQRYAEFVNALTLLVFQNLGVQDGLVSNDHFELKAFTLGELSRAEKTNLPEDKPALVLVYTLKENDCVPLRIGYNLLDKRLEFFPSDEECEFPIGPPPTETTTPPPGETTPPSSSTPETTNPPQPTTTTEPPEEPTTTTSSSVPERTTTTVPTCTGDKVLVNGVCTTPSTIPPPPVTTAAPGPTSPPITTPTATVPAPVTSAPSATVPVPTAAPPTTRVEY